MKNVEIDIEELFITIENRSIRIIDGIYIMEHGAPLDVDEQLMDAQAYHVNKSMDCIKEGVWVWDTLAGMNSGEFESYMEYDLTNIEQLQLVESELDIYKGN